MYIVTDDSLHFRPVWTTTIQHSNSNRVLYLLHHNGACPQPNLALHRPSGQWNHQCQLHRKFRLRGRYYSSEKRAGAYGMIGSIWGVGFIIGPLVGGLLAGGIPPSSFFGPPPPYLATPPSL